MAERKTGQQARRAWTFRTAAQRLTGLALLLIGLAGLWYWRQQPLPGGADMRQAVLAGQAFCLPVGLWQILYCPRRNLRYGWPFIPCGWRCSAGCWPWG